MKHQRVVPVDLEEEEDRHNLSVVVPVGEDHHTHPLVVLVEVDHHNHPLVSDQEEVDHHNHLLMDQVVAVRHSLAALGLVGRPLLEGALLRQVVLEAWVAQDPFRPGLEEDHLEGLDQSDYSQNS